MWFKKKCHFERWQICIILAVKRWGRKASLSYIMRSKILPPRKTNLRSETQQANNKSKSICHPGRQITLFIYWPATYCIVLDTADSTVDIVPAVSDKVTGELWQRRVAVLWEHKGHLVPTWEPRTSLLGGGCPLESWISGSEPEEETECRANELQRHMMWLHAGTGRGWGVRGHPLLQGRLQARLGYMRPLLKKQKQRLEKWQLKSNASWFYRGRGFVPSTHMASHNHLLTPVPEHLIPLLTSAATRHTHKNQKLCFSFCFWYKMNLDIYLTLMLAREAQD